MALVGCHLVAPDEGAVRSSTFGGSTRAFAARIAREAADGPRIDQFIRKALFLRPRTLTSAASIAFPLVAMALASMPLRGRAAATPRTAERDRQAVVALENEWLSNVRDPKVLDCILAADFVHAISTGDFLTKAEHISWCIAHPLPPDRKSHFERLDVRAFRDLGIASGIVWTRDGTTAISRSVFTDVFAFRAGRWQAIHAQETTIDQPPPTK